MKKIGLLSLALVLALGTLGVGYAMWSDEVIIDGTVNTGSVEISIEDVSETYVYKNTTSPDREMVMSKVPLQENGLKLIASATVTEDKSDPDVKKVTMNFTNIFPTDPDIEADVVLHYTGSVPVHVVLEEDVPDPAIAKYLIQKWFTLNETEDWVETDIDGIQLHYCDRVMLVVSLNGTALQEDGKDAQGVSGTFTKRIIVHQWNEEWPPTP